jgi:2'-5' RNA ligase
VGINSESGLGILQNEIEQALAGLGIEPEKRAFSPHLTLARAAGGWGAPARGHGDKPGRQFVRLRQALEKGPTADFGAMVAGDFFLYRSQLSPKGARYTKLARFALEREEQG